MSISTRQRFVDTSHGFLAVEESGQGEIPVLLIHGNSFSRAVFRHQLQGSLAKSHRLIAFDLPGHGESSNAPDPVHTYTRPGLADATIELLENVGVSEAIVFGWSLGGHIGMEMLSHFPGMRGLMISGAPPVSSNQMSQGFNASRSKAWQANRSCLKQRSTLSWKTFSVNRRKRSSGMPSRALTAVFGRGSSRLRVLEMVWISA